MPNGLEGAFPAAIRLWEASDPVMARLAQEHRPNLRFSGRTSAFSSLAVSLVHQQVSVAAGRAIWRRVRDSCGGRVTPASVLSTPVGRLRRAGLSRQKLSYLRDLAAKVQAREVPIRRFRTMTDTEIVESLTQVKGIGVWTAKMFLLFHLERPDVLAEEDLGLQIATARAYKVPIKRARRFLEGRRRAWSPYSTIASMVLWRSKDGARSKG